MVQTGVLNPETTEVTLGETWSIDLTTIFKDEDNDTLSYGVKIGDAEAVAAEASYSYTPEAVGTVTFVFTANDGKEDSEPFTVYLSVIETAPSYNFETEVVDNFVMHRGSFTVPMGQIAASVNGENVVDKVVAGKTVDITATSTPFVYADQFPVYDSLFDHWEFEGVNTDGLDLTQDSLQIVMPENDVKIKAVFVRQGSKVTLTANTYSAGDVYYRINNFSDTSNSTYDYNLHKHGYDSVSNIVIKDAMLEFQVEGMYDNYNPAYELTGWEIQNVTTGSDVDVSYYESAASGRSYQAVSFTVDGTSEYTVKAIFEARDYGSVDVSVNDESMGSASARVGAAQPSTNLVGVVVGSEVSLSATANTGYIFKSWEATLNGESVEISNANNPEASFIMPAANHGTVDVVATFERDPSYLSSECALEGVELLGEDGNPIGIVNQDGMDYEIVLPAGTDAGSIADMVLKLTVSDYATVRKAGDAEDWPDEGKACGMEPGVAAEFTVTAEDGTHSNTYTITITVDTPDAPVLSNGSAERTGERTAVVKFTSSEAGIYYYQVVEHGGNAEVDTTVNGFTAAMGENTINLNNLTADARDILIVVKSAIGAVSDQLRVEIPEYEEPGPSTGEYTISVSAPAGGTLVTNVTSADEGDSVFVSATPDPGYRMVEDSLVYTLNVAGGSTVKIVGNRFQMPAGDVTVSCQWEKIPSGEPGSETGSEGILSFVINGVTAVIGSAGNNSYMITLTLPHGTDVTNLVPAIIVADGVTLTPGIGEAIDFTRPVTYTATLADGTELTYVVSVYVQAGSLAESMWEKLIDFYNQIPWWQYAEHQQSYGNYPNYWY